MAASGLNITQQPKVIRYGECVTLDLCVLVVETIERGWLFRSPTVVTHALYVPASCLIAGR
jgi:hypothetical protein